MVLALRNARRVLDLINQLLDIAKLEVGEMPLAAQPLDLARLARAEAQRFAPLAERKRTALRVEMPPEPAVAWFDLEKLEKVFSNLLSNALKFTPEGSASGCA